MLTFSPKRPIMYTFLVASCAATAVVESIGTKRMEDPLHLASCLLRPRSEREDFLRNREEDCLINKASLSLSAVSRSFRRKRDS